MENFRKFITNKFHWGNDDIEHHSKPKKKPLTPMDERRNRFIWQPGDVEKHESEPVKEDTLVEFKLHAYDHGNHANPKHIEKDSWQNHHQTDQSPEEGSEEHESFRHHHDNKLTDAHREYIADYKRDSEPLNRYLRTNKGHHKPGPDSRTYEHDRHHSFIKNMDHVTSHSTEHDHTSYRGGHPKDHHHFPIGHVFTDHGYTGSSFRRNVASDFARKKQGTDKSIVHVIHSPKGTKAHYLDVHGSDSEHSNAHEKELLHHRGTKFKVTHHSEDDNHHYIHMKVHSQRGLKTPVKESILPFSRAK